LAEDTMELWAYRTKRMRKTLVTMGGGCVGPLRALGCKFQEDKTI
jgi:hypothetical protein